MLASLARPMLAATLACASLAAIAPTARAASERHAWSVVLADGTEIQAHTRPLIALGKVSFLDASDRQATLPVRAIDLAATRNRLGANPLSSTRTWNQRSLAGVHGGVQFLGQLDASSPGKTAEAIPVEDGGLTTAETVRNQIESIDEKLGPLGPQDHQRTILMMQQRELREQLDRLLSSRS